MASISVDDVKRRIVGARGQETGVALQVHLVRGHAEHDAPRFARCVADRAGMAGGAVQPDQAHASGEEGRADRPAVRGAAIDESQPLVARARAVRQLVGEDDRQHAPDPVGEAGPLLGADRAIAEVIGDIRERRGLGLSARGDPRREQADQSGHGHHERSMWHDVPNLRVKSLRDRPAARSASSRARRHSSRLRAPDASCG